MKPRISVLTLGVADLEQSLEFYRDGLGLPTEWIIGREFKHGAVAFFELSGGMKLAIFAQGDLAHDTGLSKTPNSLTSWQTIYLADRSVRGTNRRNNGRSTELRTQIARHVVWKFAQRVQSGLHGNDVAIRT